jgi:predicted Rossmann fold flavoprotein
MQQWDVVIVGAGAAGLMCAIESAKRGRRTLLLDHAKAPGEKIRISGGGRCNFTNIHAAPANYISHNPRFCISALNQYTQHDFINLVEQHGITYHEKTLGQLFCDGSSQQIIQMLCNECAQAQVTLKLQTAVKHVSNHGAGFKLTTSAHDIYATESLVVATGGLSIPKMGASGWAYDIAEQFNISVIAPRPALVPFTLDNTLLTSLKPLAGVSLPIVASYQSTSFPEAMLFTHRGLSGPAILQISSYWHDRQPVQLNLLPDEDISALLRQARHLSPKQELQTIMSQYLPKRLAAYLCEHYQWKANKVGELSNKRIEHIAATLHQWQITPVGTEGYRTAEVTLGGIDTNALSSKTMECNDVKGLYFIGEAVDVTGWLGGYNFQWAWSSGYAAGQYV